MAAAVGTGGPFLSISFEERTQTPPASSPTSVLIPLYSPLRTLLSVLQCRHHYQTDSSASSPPEWSNVRAQLCRIIVPHWQQDSCAREGRRRRPALLEWEGGREEGGHASASAPAADARSRASANLHEMNMISVSRSRSAGSRWIMGCRNICSTVPDGREVVRKRHKSYAERSDLASFPQTPLCAIPLFPFPLTGLIKGCGRSVSVKERRD